MQQIQAKDTSASPFFGIFNTVTRFVLIFGIYSILIAFYNKVFSNLIK